ETHHRARGVAGAHAAVPPAPRGQRLPHPWRPARGRLPAFGMGLTRGGAADGDPGFGAQSRARACNERHRAGSGATPRAARTGGSMTKLLLAATTAVGALTASAVAGPAIG